MLLEAAGIVSLQQLGLLGIVLVLAAVASGYYDARQEDR